MSDDTPAAANEQRQTNIADAFSFWAWVQSNKGALKVTIPDSVTSIGDGAFDGCSSLSAVTIPDSVTRIGDSAFSNCSSLAVVTIPHSVTSISEYAFRECSSLSAVTIPDSVTSIGKYAFYMCSSLAAVTIGGSVTSIAKFAFYKCFSLAAVTIPDSVTSIGKNAFNECSSLAAATIPDSEPLRDLLQPLLDESGFKPTQVHVIGGASEASELDAKRAIDQPVRLAAVLGNHGDEGKLPGGVESATFVQVPPSASEKMAQLMFRFGK